MMSNTGGGHKASAEALQQAFREEFGTKYKVGGEGLGARTSVGRRGRGGYHWRAGRARVGPAACARARLGRARSRGHPSSTPLAHPAAACLLIHHPRPPNQIIIVDMWKEHTPVPFNSLCDSYSFLVRHSVLWRVTYGVMQPRAIHAPYFSAVQAFVAAQLSAAFDAYDPDLVISVHPLMQHIPVRVLAARAAATGAAPPPFATVVTDFTTCHNTWFYPGVTRCFVPTDYCRNLAVTMGIAPAKVVVHGLPIRPVFSKRLPSKDKLRSRLVGCRAAWVGGGRRLVTQVIWKGSERRARPRQLCPLPRRP
jgi:hypothetical protein